MRLPNKFDGDRNRLTITISTQTHYNVRNNLAEILGIPEYDVRVIAEDVGGGFGAKWLSSLSTALDSALKTGD